MPAQRSYQVKVLASAIPESVTVDGQKQDFVYLNEEFALLVDIPQKDCNREKVVAIEYPASEVNLDGLFGAAKRVAKAMVNTYKCCFLQMLYLLHFSTGLLQIGQHQGGYTLHTREFG